MTDGAIILPKLFLYMGAFGFAHASLIWALGPTSARRGDEVSHNSNTIDEEETKETREHLETILTKFSIPKLLLL